MFKKQKKVIAINPGSRYLGIAVFHGPELRDWRVKVVNGKGVKEKTKKVRSIVLSFIEQHNPDVIVIKKLNPSHSPSNLNKIVGNIKDLSKRKGIRVYEYSIKDMETRMSPKERINKKKMTKIIASKYPDLLYELKKEESSKNSYYIRMFEAVALGSVCLNQLDKH